MKKRSLGSGELKLLLGSTISLDSNIDATEEEHNEWNSKSNYCKNHHKRRQSLNWCTTDTNQHRERSVICSRVESIEWRPECYVHSLHDIAHHVVAKVRVWKCVFEEFINIIATIVFVKKTRYVSLMEFRGSRHSSVFIDVTNRSILEEGTARIILRSRRDDIIHVKDARRKFIVKIASLVELETALALVLRSQVEKFNCNSRLREVRCKVFRDQVKLHRLRRVEEMRKFIAMRCVCKC